MWVGGVATCAPFVCVVVAHGWNIIEFFLLLSGLCAGWWWGKHAVGSWENRPPRPRVMRLGCVVGGVGVCGSPGRPCSWAPAVVGVCGWVSGGGSWFFHSGREHLGIMTAPVGVVVVFCVIFVVVFLVLSDSRCCMRVVRGGGVSVQERMVDALASGADEGRGNLR